MQYALARVHTQRRAQKRTKYSRDRIRTYLQLKNYAQEVGEHQ